MADRNPTGPSTMTGLEGLPRACLDGFPTDLPAIGRPFLRGVPGSRLTTGHLLINPAIVERVCTICCCSHQYLHGSICHLWLPCLFDCSIKLFAVQFLHCGGLLSSPRASSSEPNRCCMDWNMHLPRSWAWTSLAILDCNTTHDHGGLVPTETTSLSFPRLLVGSNGRFSHRSL